MICAVVVGMVWRVEVSGSVYEFMRPALMSAKIIQLIHALIRWREENTALVYLKRI